MTTRILLAVALAAAGAACARADGPGPAAPVPVAADPAPVDPAPAPAEPAEPVAVPAPAPADEWKACHEAEDCVAVGCSCSCSGCGGFSSEDVISKDFEEAWYEEKGCERVHVCPEVCCDPMTIVCQDGLCGVVAGHVKNVH